MPDLIGIANQLKTLPDQALASELQNPSGAAPAYLVLGELQRRQLLRAGGGTQQKAETSVLQDTMRQLEPPRPTGPPPPPGMTPPTMAQPRAGLAAAMPGATPPQNMAMPMRPMQEGGLVADDPFGGGDYLSELALRQQYNAGDLLPGMYRTGGPIERFQEGGEEEDDNEAESPSAGYAARSAPDYDPTPAEQALLNEIARRESGGNPYARSNKSTASGLYQFINPTWRRTANETGVGTKYPTAAQAPTRDQQINALHLLRTYGPNASESWAASGPYATPPPTPDAGSAAAPTLLAANSAPPPGPSAAPAASAAPAPAPAAPATWPAPATRITFPQPPEAAALATEQQNLATLRGQAMDTQERYNRNKAAMDAQFGSFDDSNSRAGIQWLMNEAQQNLHPSISSTLLRMGLSLLAAPATGFGQALGRAGIETLDALDKQKQGARQEWVDALKLGIQLDDKQREYNYQRAQLAQSATSTQESHWQSQVNQTQKQIDTLQTKLGANKQYQQDQRGQQWNQLNPDRQLTGPFDPNFQKLSPEEQHLYLGQNLPAEAKPTRPTFQMQTAEDRAHQLASANKVPITQGQSAMDALRAAGRYDLATQAAEDTAAAEARKQTAEDRQAQQDQARSDKSYQFNIGELNRLAKPYEDMLPRYERLQTTLSQNNPQADALVAPELLTVMAGGAGSGLRMNEAEIRRIVTGRNAWENLKSSIERYQLDPSKPFLITPTQRMQIKGLLDAVGQKLNSRIDQIYQARNQLIGTDNPTEHRKIVAGLHEGLAGTVAAPALPKGNGQKLDRATAQKFLNAAGGDPAKARNLATQNNWIP